MIKRSISLLPSLVTVLLASSQHSVRFVISSRPLKNSNDNNLFIAGSFNGWNPRDKNYQFQKNDEGNYFLGTKLEDGNYEFKITRADGIRWNVRKEEPIFRTDLLNLHQIQQ